MPGQPQNSNSNPLSFSGTKALRDLLLTKNLPNPEGLGPYGNYTNSTYSTASLAVKDVIDQPDVTETSEFFVDKLYLANAYGPEGGFGNFIKIYLKNLWSQTRPCQYDLNLNELYKMFGLLQQFNLYHPIYLFSHFRPSCVDIISQCWKFIRKFRVQTLDDFHRSSTSYKIKYLLR